MSLIKILSSPDRAAFDAPPHFSAFERKRFLQLPAGLKEILLTLRQPTNKVCFLLQAAYFRASCRFFGRRFHPPDVQTAVRLLNLSPERVSIADYPKQILVRHQQIILEFFGFRRLEQADLQWLAADIAAGVRIYLRPKHLFHNAAEKLTARKIALPPYHRLAALITTEINRHKDSLNQIIRDNLTPEQKARLDSLFDPPQVLWENANNTDLPSENDASLMKKARLSLLRQPSQSTKPNQIKANLADWQTLQVLYAEFTDVIRRLDLSSEGWRYYAHAVLKAELFAVRRKRAEERYLYLLAFIAHQTFRYHDALVDSFLQAVNTAVNTATRLHREHCYQNRHAERARLQSLLENVRDGILPTFDAIKQIAVSSASSETAAVAAEKKLAAVSKLILAGAQQRADLDSLISELARNLSRADEERDFYDVLGDQSLKLQKRAAEVVKSLTVVSDPDSSSSSVNEELVAALRYFQSKHGNLEKTAPREFLSDKEQRLLSQAERFPVGLYKVLLFQKLAEGVKAGSVNLPHSHKFRALDDYLIGAEKWRAEKPILLRQAELPRTGAKKLLKQLGVELNSQFRRTNLNLKDGANPHLKFKTEKGFSVTTPKADALAEAVKLKQFFPKRRVVALSEVLSTVNRATAFADEFELWHKSGKQLKPKPETLLAAIVGYGCDVGTQRIAQICRQVSEREIETCVNRHLSLANLQLANDRITSFLSDLALPNLYRRQAGQLHTSSDGQKFEVSAPSLNANYSFKYFGQNKGVSVYSFIDERHLLFYSTVISSSEREAAYVIDGLLHNESIKSDIHSTDSRGYTEVVFGVTYLLGFTFAPRLKSLDKQRLYSLEKRRVYQKRGYRILPAAYIDTDLIIEMWDEILRFVAIIKLKHTTASQLFKRLNSYSKQNKLYRALKEFGKIIKTLFILRYIDDVELRQAIEKQLNKIESANKFAKAVAFGHSEEMSQGEKDEQEIAEAARRLIKNAIICWNYLYLTQKLTDAAGDEAATAELLTAVKEGSVVAWQHINLHGEYDFSEEKRRDSVGLDIEKIKAFEVS